MTNPSKISIGIDYSMTCPAACAYDAAGPSFWFAHASKWDVTLPNVATYSIASQATDNDTKRFTHLARAVLRWLERFDVDTVSIEDYAFNATGRVFHIGENAGILKYHLDSADIEYIPIPPTVIKKFATGKGNADKHKMTAAFLDAFPAARAWIPVLFPRTKDDGIVAKSPLADLADAYWIARYSAERT